MSLGWHPDTDTNLEILRAELDACRAEIARLRAERDEIRADLNRLIRGQE